MKIGAQLYTVRGFCRDTDGLYDTLKKVAGIGYKYVQLSGVCSYDPAWMKKTLDELGLSAPITHTDPGLIVNETEKVLADHKAFGCPYIGIGGMPAEFRNSLKGVGAFAEKFMAAAEYFSKNGAKLMYHNHNFEFAKFGGECALDLIAMLFPKERLGFTLDTYWVQAGGGDPAQWLEKLAGRVDCIHLKDMSYNGGQVYAPIYEGNMNFDRIIPAAVSAGAKYAFVELDDCYGRDPFESLKVSFDNVTKRFPELA